MNPKFCVLIAFAIVLCVSRGNHVDLDQIPDEQEAPFSFQSLTDLVFNESVEIGVSRLSMLMVPTLITAAVIKEANSVYDNAMDIVYFQHISQDLMQGRASPDLSKLYGLMLISAVANYILGAIHIERNTLRSFLALGLSSLQFSFAFHCALYAINETGLLGTAQICQISRETAFLFNLFITMLVLYPYIMRTLETADELIM